MPGVCQDAGGAHRAGGAGGPPLGGGWRGAATDRHRAHAFRWASAYLLAAFCRAGPTHRSPDPHPLQRHSLGAAASDAVRRRLTACGMMYRRHAAGCQELVGRVHEVFSHPQAVPRHQQRLQSGALLRNARASGDSCVVARPRGHCNTPGWQRVNSGLQSFHVYPCTCLIVVICFSSVSHQHPVLTDARVAEHKCAGLPERQRRAVQRIPTRQVADGGRHSW